jgi:hypothetical protein
MLTARRMLVILLLVGLSTGLFADSRSQGIDILILLDRSKSMAEQGKLAQSRDWLTASFIGPLVIPGDSVTLISFYGKTKTVWDAPINSEKDKKNLVRALAGLKANGRWTDIGNALDTLKTRIEAFPKNDARFKYIILVTDERQEAPPESRYFSKDGSFSHSYLTYTRKESHGSWSVITLGIGIDDKVSKSMQEVLPVLDEMPVGRSSALEEGLPSGGSESSGGPVQRFVKSLTGWTLVLYAGLGAVLLLAIVFIILLIARKRAREDKPNADNGPANRA